MPTATTLRLVDALVKAEKYFDLLVIPGADHASGGDRGMRKRRHFSVHHLLGAEPPDRNAPERAPAEEGR